LIAFGTVAAALSQEQNPTRETQPEKKPLLDFRFPQFRSRTNPPARNRFAKQFLNPNGQLPYLVLRSDKSSQCSIPLLEAPVPEGTGFKIKGVRPPSDKAAAMGLVDPPAPPCAQRPAAPAMRK